MVRVTYEIVMAERGWYVWRKLGEGRSHCIGRRAHQSLRDAQNEVHAQKRADRAAGTRLGVEVEFIDLVQR